MLALFFAFVFSTFANQTCDFPQTSARFDVSASSGITHGQMLWAIAKVKAVYAPVAKRQGFTLVFSDLWSDPTVNSDTYRQGAYWIVEAFGGLARFPGMTANAYLEVLCHEVGHQLGGQPTFNGGTDWASVEGQADYWATAACMKAVGINSAIPSLTLAKTLARLDGEQLPWRPGPPLPEVSQTFEEHPLAQCRLNTYDAGRLNQPRPRCWFAP